MLFNSYSYLLFLPVIFILYYVAPKRLRWLILLTSSYFFYMYWNAEYAMLMLFSTVITYIFPLLSGKTESKKLKKYYLTANLSINLIVLFIFKYLNFFNQLVVDFANLLNIEFTPWKVNLLLPIGISFYTFQALSYSIDVYLGKIEPEKHFGKYALFVSFFPTLLAGPIQRFNKLFPQLDSARKPDISDIKYGLSLILWGLFKKMVIADRLSIFVNTVYSKPADYNGMEILIATLFFTFQIYCDFSGYSDMAIGSARILGFDLLKNFNRPYTSKNIDEFWKRWHISLTSWFREYLYFPLGGNRRHHIRNILIVFIVSGLWHGANITFIIWGFINGVYLVVGKLSKPYSKKVLNVLNIDTENLTYSFLRTLINMILIAFSWIFFRANNINDLGIVLGKLFKFDYFHLSYLNNIYDIGLNKWNIVFSIIAIVFLMLVEYFEEHKPIYTVIGKEPFLTKAFIYIFLVLSIIVFGIYGDNQAAQFIYFQF